MVLLDYRSGRPIYEQISSYFERLILSGIMLADEQMPSVRGLAMELSTNPNTVQKAYNDLEERGFIYSVKGKGNFVRENPGLIEEKKRELVERIKDIECDAREFGLEVEELVQLALQEMEKQDD